MCGNDNRKRFVSHAVDIALVEGLLAAAVTTGWASGYVLDPLLHLIVGNALIFALFLVGSTVLLATCFIPDPGYLLSPTYWLSRGLTAMQGGLLAEVKGADKEPGALIALRSALQCLNDDAGIERAAAAHAGILAVEAFIALSSEVQRFGRGARLLKKATAMIDVLGRETAEFARLFSPNRNDGPPAQASQALISHFQAACGWFDERRHKVCEQGAQEFVLRNVSSAESLADGGTLTALFRGRSRLTLAFAAAETALLAASVGLFMAGAPRDERWLIISFFCVCLLVSQVNAFCKNSNWMRELSELCA